MKNPTELLRSTRAQPKGSTTSTIHGPLVTLGVDPKIIYAGLNRHGLKSRLEMGFWHRHAHDLHGILKDVQRAWKAAIKQAHEDKGGTHERAVIINAAWARAKKLFAQRGVTLD